VSRKESEDYGETEEMLKNLEELINTPIGKSE